MSADNHKELEARIKILEAENKSLAAQAEEILLLGLIAESLGTLENADQILVYTLERIALLKDIPYCAFCELLDSEAYILNAYATFREETSSEDRVHISPELVNAFESGSQIFTVNEHDPPEISIHLENSDFSPRTVLMIPFSARLIPKGILLCADDENAVDRLSPSIVLLERVLEIIISRLDNLSLVQELKHLNLALNMEVDRRVGELRATNEQLREAMMQRLRVEDALLRQRDLISNISEASPVGITILDKQGQITYANASAEKVLGLSLSEIANRKYNDPKWKITDYHGDPFPEDELPFSLVMKNARPVYNVQHAIEWPDGKRILLSINAAPLFNDENQVDGMVSVVEDITDQIAADMEFRRLQNFNTSIVQNISEGIVVQDAAGYFTFVNPAAAEMLEFAPEELIGKHWKEFIPADQHEIIENADNRRLRGISDRYEVELVQKNGRRLPVLVSGSPRSDARSGEFLGSLATLLDISEQKEAEKIRRALRDLALKLSATTGVENILRLCVEAAIRHANMEVGGIYLVDRFTDDLFLAYSQGLSQEFVDQTAFYQADSPSAQKVWEAKPYYANYTELSISTDDFRYREGLRTVAALPILYESKVIACLNVGSRTLEVISESTKNYLELLSTQIGSAVARAQAEDQLKQRVDQLALLNDVGEQIAAVLDLESVFERTVQLVHKSFGYQHVAVFTVDWENNKACLRTCAGSLKQLFAPDHTLKLGQGVVGNAAKNNETVLANDVSAEPRFVNLYPDVLHTQAELSVPIQIGGEVAGVIDVQSLKRNAFDERDVLVIETLADQVAVAIHNANLHADVQRELDERRRVEVALRESEERFRGLSEATFEAIFISQKGICIEQNAAAQKMFGYTLEDAIGRYGIEWIAEEDRDLVMQNMLAGYEEPYEVTALRKDGTTFSAEIHGRQAQYKGHTVRVTALRDITDRKAAEKALQESEEKFRNIVQSSPMGMHMYQLEPDDRLVFVDANPAADLILGVNNQQFIGKTIEDAFPSLAQTEVPERYRLAASTGTPWQTQQISYEENEISGAFEVYAFQTSANRMVALFLEITERKRAEEALRRSENTLSSIFRVAPTGMGLVSDRILLQVNQRICEMTGYTQEELIGQNARVLYPTDADYEYVGREKYRQIRELGTGTVETRWQHKDGQIIDVLMSSSPVDSSDLTGGVTFTALDITERKLAETRIQRQLRRLAALNQIDAAITGNLDLDRTIEILLEQTVRQLDITAAAVLLYSAPTQTLEYYTSYGLQTNAIQGVSLRLGQDFAGRVALERRTIRTTDEDQHFRALEQFAAEGFRSYFGVPLIAKGQIKGVLEVFDCDVLDPSSGWLSFLETLAGQAAIAIDNASMVENLERSNLELRLAYNTTLEGWAKALELRDFETQGHSRRVTELVIRVARAVGIPEDELVHVHRGALLHDIGKMGIPDQILLKNGPLDDEEWRIMRQHPVYAYEMLSQIEFLRPALDIPRYHHEKWDGTGYPYGLKGDEIPLPARVFAIIDVWDALLSDRPYRAALDESVVLGHIEAQIGKHFDPRVAQAFLGIVQNNK